MVATANGIVLLPVATNASQETLGELASRRSGRFVTQAS